MLPPCLRAAAASDGPAAPLRYTLRQALSLTVRASHGWYCHSTLLLAVIGCHSLGIYTVTLLALLSFSGEMTVSPCHSPSGPALRAATLPPCCQ
jgi:hypothetical protein